VLDARCVEWMTPSIFCADACRSRQCCRSRGEHPEIGDSSRNQKYYRGREGEFGGCAAVATQAVPTTSHSARATVLIFGRLVRPALVHPSVSKLEFPLIVRVSTTSSRHLGPALLGCPWNVIDEFGK
jgi:hypothetical protein